MIDDALLDRIPMEPGVYIFKDAAGAVIYVGKAINLRARVRQYFRGGDERFFVAAGFLGRAAVEVETIIVNAEKEALLLENHLIKQHQPKFNVKLRDDKQYLVLRVLPADSSPDAERRHQFPRVEVVRNIQDDRAQYFGPYHSATSARQTLRLLNRHFQLRTCTDHVLETRGRPCLQFQIKRCPAPCARAVTPTDYAEQVDDVMMFLGGKDQQLAARLRTRMAARAEAEDYESAAALRDSLGAVERTLSKQSIVQDDFVDQDVWGLWRQADAAWISVLFVRAGKLVGKRTFDSRDQELPDSLVLAEHAQRYYDSGTFIPDEVAFSRAIEGGDALAEWLTSLRGQNGTTRRAVKVTSPERGTRAALAELADRNAAAAAVSARGRDDDTQGLLEKLQTRLALPRLPRRIECFDIAHISGTDTVASMVTFIDGVPAKSRYRTFKIKHAGNDDFESMYEVIGRRFKRAAKLMHERAAEAAGRVGALPASPVGRGDEPLGNDAWEAPDLLVIDGGKGQLGRAIAALEDLGVPMTGGIGIAGDPAGVTVIGLAKERELFTGDAPDRVYTRGAREAIALRPNSPELFVLARIRDEAHRFANTFHRQRRSARTLRSELDAIPGIGPVRRKNLLRHFGSVRGIREATEAAIAAVPGMTVESARAVAEHLARAETDSAVPASNE